MDAYTLTPREYRALKFRLTRALNQLDARRIVQEADHAFAVFDEKGWPDDWSRWQSARDDAEFTIKRRAVWP